MAGVRVSELAKKHGMRSREVLERLHSMGEFFKAPSSSVPRDVVRRFEQELAEAERPAKPATEIRDVTAYVSAVLAFSDEDNVLFRGQRNHAWMMNCGLGRLKPRVEGNLLATEQLLVDGFKRQSLPHLHREMRDEWDVLAMAQHHGLATRLLDWTENPLAALWFAVKDPPLGHEPGTVHMFEPAGEDLSERDTTSPYDIKMTQFFQPSHLNARIVAQGGWFSVHAWNPRKQLFHRLERLGRYRDRIEALHIPAEAFPDLRAQLDRLGINHATMFPDLDGLTKHLNWLHSLAPDE